MKIVVISDTHLKREEKWLPQEVEKALQEADLMVHCGDFVVSPVYERLKKLNKKGKLIAVHGNMDAPELVNILPAKATFEAAGYRIGVIHGFGSPQNLIDKVKSEFERIEIILFGHSHSPINEVKEGILFFNPGSPTDKRFAPFNSYGVLELGQEIKRKIIVLK
jgi:hypothetical protein